MSRAFQVGAGGEEKPVDVEQEALAALDRDDRRQALNLLMSHYGDAVYSFCRRHLRDETLAEDVHQQCFVQAWEDLPRFSRRSSLKTWLFSIANHRCMDAAKSRRRLWNRIESPAVLPEAEDPSPRAEEVLQGNMVGRALNECLKVLAPAAQTAVTLRYTEGFTYEQMAVICGEKAGTLQARVARSMPALRNCLEARGGRDDG